MIRVMAARGGAMHVARNRRTYTAKSGEQRVYESVLVRRTYRDGAKVRHETLANLSALPAEAVSAIEATLKGERLVPAGQAVQDHRLGAARARRRRARGRSAAGPARAAGPGGPAAGPGPGPDHLPGGPAGLQAVHPDLVERHHPGRRPRRRRCQPPMTSTPRWTGWSTGRTRSRRTWPAATWPRTQPVPDGAVRPVVLVAGRLAVPAGRPRVLPGRQERETADRVRAAHRPRRPPGRGPGLPRQHRRPAAFTAIADVVRKKFGLAQMVMVGDRGMITSARIAALNQAGDGTQRPDADTYGWITALRAPAIRKLMADDGPLQLSPVRPAGPRRDHLARLPRRAADRLPQPGPGRRPRPHPRGPAGRHREAARPPHRPGPVRPPAPAPGPSGSRSAR